MTIYFTKLLINLNYLKPIFYNTRALSYVNSFVPTRKEKFKTIEILKNSSYEKLLDFGLPRDFVTHIVQSRSIDEPRFLENYNNQNLFVINQLLFHKDDCINTFQNLLRLKDLAKIKKGTSEDDLDNYLKESSTESSIWVSKKFKKKVNIDSLLISDDNYLKKKINTFTSIYVSNSKISWVHFNGNQEIIDFLLTDLSNYDPVLLNIVPVYNQIHKCVKQIPTSDCIVIENSYRDNKGSPLLNIVFGILLELFHPNNVEETHPFAIMNSNIVNNLFNLLIGRERVSARERGEELLCSMTAQDGASFVPPWEDSIWKPSGRILGKYLLAREDVKDIVATNILIGVAFHAVYIRKNTNAHKWL